MPRESCDLDADREMVRAHPNADAPSSQASGGPVQRFDEADHEIVQRYDFTPIGKATKTSQGFLKFDARLSRVGVLTYRKADGKIQKELRPPDEVFDEKSIETLAGAPVTDLHSAMVDPSNVRKLQMGIVGESVHHDDKFIHGRVTVQDQGLIDKISSGERKEGSPGYECYLDWTPGSYNGERYDAVQRNIRYNHWALGPNNWGRQGSDVALRLDGNAAASLDNPPQAAEDKEIEEMTTPIKRTVRIDGIDYNLDSTEAQQAVNRLITTYDSDKKAHDAALGELQGRFDAATKELGEVKKKLDEANDPKRIDALVNERADLLSKARGILGKEEKLDGLSTRQIQVLTLKKLDDKFSDEGKDDAYINGVFDYSVKNHEASSRSDGLGAARKASPTPPSQKKDGKSDGGQDQIDHYDAAAAHERMLQRNSEAWKKGLNN